MNANEVKSKLGAFKKVSNMKSNNGNTIPNQFELKFENGVLFQSYDSIIAIKFFINDSLKELSNKIVLGVNYDYSNTTKKYLKKFLWNDGIVETRKKILSNEYFYFKDLK